MEPVLVHHRLDRRQFGDLMSDRLRVVGLQALVAPAALGQFADDEVAELLGKDEPATRALRRLKKANNGS